jgi:hypothetical protein
MKQKQFSIIALIVFTLFCAGTIHAQNNFVFIHGLGGIPLDQSSKNYYNAGFGGEAGVGISLTKTTYFVPSIGYTSFSGKGAIVRNSNDTITVPSESYIPLKVGIRQYLKSKTVFFDGDLGVGFVSNSVPTQQTPNPSSSRFAADIGAGVILGNLELGLNFDTFQEPKPDGWSGWLVFKAGWNIKL